MMISPEEYYNMELAGKTTEQIASKIRGLKRTITQLQHTMEQPDYAPTICPSEDVQLWCTRDYLSRAIEAYKDAGGIYELTKAEQRAAKLHEDLEKITCLKFSIGGFFGGWQTRVVTFPDYHFFISTDYIFDPDNKEEMSLEWPETKDEFIDCLRNLHLDEWKHNFDNPCVLDGTQWELKIEFGSKRKALSYSGSNAYPYNFDKLCELVGYEWDDEDE